MNTYWYCSIKLFNLIPVVWHILDRHTDRQTDRLTELQVKVYEKGHCPDNIIQIKHDKSVDR